LSPQGNVSEKNELTKAENDTKIFFWKEKSNFAERIKRTPSRLEDNQHIAHSAENCKKKQKNSQFPISHFFDEKILKKIL
jgi:hypothetical protein